MSLRLTVEKHAKARQRSTTHKQWQRLEPKWLRERRERKEGEGKEEGEREGGGRTREEGEEGKGGREREREREEGSCSLRPWSGVHEGGVPSTQ